VVLKWLLQRGIAPLPESRSAAHLRENLAVGGGGDASGGGGDWSWRLSEGEMVRIAALDRGERGRVGFDPNLIL